jgi:hypothetical protein
LQAALLTSHARGGDHRVDGLSGGDGLFAQI